MTLPPLRIGTRKSELAISQSTWVMNQLSSFGLPCTLRYILSEGDIDRHTPLYESPTVGVFTKQLESALLRDEIDIAVHSYKDLPTRLPEGLEIIAIPPREDSRDCLILHERAFASGSPLALKSHSIVGTSSLRREGYLKKLNPTLTVTSLRGNVPTRISHVEDGKLDAVILAKAGLSRLEWGKRGLPPQLHQFIIEDPECVSAPAQGALAIEARNDIATAAKELISKIHDPKTALETQIERKILQDLGGGCSLPLGVLCQIDKEVLTLRGSLSNFRHEETNREKIFEKFFFFEEQGLVSKVDRLVASLTEKLLKIQR